jgi:c-di-GMP-binding flagellar brake protein YcgR
MASADRRRSARVPISLSCTLERRSGAPISGETVDLGPGGMCVSTSRPLAPDEVLRFELPAPGPALSGEARVLRQQAARVYAMRFERLPAGARDELERLTGQPANR